MIARILDELRTQSSFKVLHLPFHFTKDVRRMRRAGLDKLFGVFPVLWRVARIRACGTIDGLLYPVGGPQLVPLVRDICLLPWMLLAGKRVILHFHAAGVAETIDHHPFVLRQLVRFLYQKASAAIVMTEFGRRDPISLGLNNVKVVPHTLEDTYDSRIVSRGMDATVKLLYVGHFAREKGTPSLLKAFAALRQTGADCVLELVGECLSSYSDDEIDSAIQQLGIRDAVRLWGVLSGMEKWERFARAELFIFPSLAPESFGLVTAEAMMWGLPIVACDWRGNREVLGEPFGGILFEPHPDFDIALRNALQEALECRQKWNEWGRINRRTFENNYKAGSSPSRLVEVLEQLV
jgi:glycosyltransferase involved in cell wall biosynthesis